MTLSQNQRDQEGNGTKLPDGFPSAGPVPECELTTAMSSNGTFAVLYQVDDAKKAFADYLKALESAGFDVSDKTEGEMNGNFFGSVSATGKGWNVQVGATSGGDEAMLTLSVEPA